MRMCFRLTPGLGGAGPRTLNCKQDAPSRVHSRPFVRRQMSHDSYTFSGENFFLSFCNSGSGTNQSSNPQVPQRRRWNLGGMVKRVMPTLFTIPPRFHLRLCGTCGLLDWFVPEPELQKLKKKFSPEKV